MTTRTTLRRGPQPDPNPEDRWRGSDWRELYAVLRQHRHELTRATRDDKLRSCAIWATEDDRAATSSATLADYRQMLREVSDIDPELTPGQRRRRRESGSARLQLVHAVAGAGAVLASPAGPAVLHLLAAPIILEPPVTSSGGVTWGAADVDELVAWHQAYKLEAAA